MDNIETLRNENWKDFFPYIQVFFYLGEGYSLETLLLVVPLYITRVNGLSTSETGAAIAFAGIPWLIKLFYGFLTDRIPIGKFGRRKPYLFLCAVISIPFWMYFTTLKDFNNVYLWTLFVISTLAAFSDTVLDGFVVDITPEEKKQVMQSAAWSGRGVGTILASLISLTLVNQHAWVTIYYIAAIVFVVTTLSALFLPTIDYEIETNLRLGFSKAFSIRATKYLLLVSVFMGAGQFMGTFGSLLLESLGFSDPQIRNIKTMFNAGYVLGAIIIGVINKRLNLTSSKLLRYILLLNIVWLPLVAVSQSEAYLIGFFFVLGMITTASVAVSAKLSMDYSPLEVSGTMFALFMGMQNLGQLVISSILSGYILDNFPPIVVVLFSAIWSILAIIFLRFVD